MSWEDCDEGRKQKHFQHLKSLFLVILEENMRLVPDFVINPKNYSTKFREILEEMKSSEWGQTE